MPIRAEIVITGGSDDRGRYLLAPGEYVIGRGESCDIILSGPGISFQHAQFILGSSQLTIVDLNSTNGTFVGQRRVEGSERISSGDRVYLGSKGVAEIRLIEDGDTPVSSRVGGDGLGEVGQLKESGDVQGSLSAAHGTVDIVPERMASLTNPLVDTDDLEKSQAADQDQLRALHEQLAAATRERNELLRRLEQGQKERQARDAAVVEEWTAILHENEGACEELAELRTTLECQRQILERKCEEFHTSTRERDGALRSLEAIRTEKSKLLEVVDEISAEAREKDSFVASTAQKFEDQKKELAEVTHELEQVRKGKNALLDEMAVLQAGHEEAIKRVRDEVETHVRERAEIEVKLTKYRKYDIYSQDPSECGESVVARLKAIAASVARVDHLMKPEETAVIGRPKEEKLIPREGDGEIRPSEPEEVRLPAKSFARRCLWGLGILGGCFGLVAGGLAGYSAYKARQLRILTSAVVGSLSRNDFEGASLNARRALQVDQNYLPALKYMAEIGERQGDSQALVWRRRVVDLSPGSAEELIAYASTALRFGKREVASEALAQVGDAGGDRADFQAVSGAAWLAQGNLAEAERCYAEAVRLAPDNPFYRLDLGNVQSGSDDYFTKEEGRRGLIEMAEHPELGRRALRALIASFERTQEFQLALRHSEMLVAHVPVPFSDEIVHLRLMRRTGNPSFREALEALQEKAGKKPGAATALVTWMNSEGLSAEAIHWGSRAFPEIAKIPGLRAAMAVSMSKIHDWPALLDLTMIGPWQEAEYGRQAYRSRAMREEGQIGLARAAWRNAVLAASSQSDALAWLAHMAVEWDWPGEHEEALLAMVSSASKDRTALNILSRRYLAEGNTSGLRRLSARLMEVDPSDVQAQNDYANLSLLLNADIARALRVAFDLYSRHPDRIDCISTYAFALHYEGRPEEALKVMEKIPPEKLEEPAYAAYYGIVLLANGIPERAQHFLRIARRGPLLREELALVEKSLRETGYAEGHAE